MAYKKLGFLSWCFLLITSYSAYSHAVYVSVCNVYEKNDTSYFSLRIFKDDIFDALNLVGESDKLTNKEKDIVINYVKKNFTVFFNEKPISLLQNKFVFEGSDYTETANLIFTTNQKIKKGKLKIINTLLLNVLDEQTNIIGIKIQNTKKTLTFNKNKKENWLQIE